MIEQLDQKTKERVNKAIGYIRLIAFRSKRANLQEAAARTAMVVDLLNEFRQYVNYNIALPAPLDEFVPFKHNTDTYMRVKQAIEQAGAIYHDLSHSKQVSYKEEYKQVWLLLTDVRDYLIKTIDRSVPHA